MSTLVEIGSVCTYGDGYKDQSVYSCRTCAEIVGHPVGVCYGCYLECHLGHDLVVELFTRRKFRCDCPSLSSTICECRLWSGEEVAPQSNVLNKYNHNFDDIFCWCKKGYSADSNAILIHCLLCEDWFHPECIKQDTRFQHSLDDDENVFVCHPCLTKTPRLLNYKNLLVASLPGSTPSNAPNPSSDTPSSQPLTSDLKLEQDAAPQAISSNPAPTCSLPKNGPQIDTHALFQVGWTAHLCRCEECKAALETSDLGFLLEDLDLKPSHDESSLVDIESNGPEGSESEQLTLAEAVRRSETKKRKRDASSASFDPLTAGLEAFSAIPHHEAKSNILHAYDAFAKQLEVFFKQAADAGKVLTTQDIHSFFDELKRKKR